jgi:hypothetical protein
MASAVWKGSDPMDRDACPYSVDFECTPAPASKLDSLESGRLMLSVRLKGGALAAGDRVDDVVARIVNKAKKRNDNDDSGSRLQSPAKSQSTSSLRREGRSKRRWSGELSIPVSWTEGGTRSYERGGSWHPNSKGELFSLEITYRLADGNSCTATFGSEDAFHWAARPKPSM